MWDQKRSSFGSIFFYIERGWGVCSIVWQIIFTLNIRQVPKWEWEWSILPKMMVDCFQHNWAYEEIGLKREPPIVGLELTGKVLECIETPTSFRVWGQRRSYFWIRTPLNKGAESGQASELILKLKGSENSKCGGSFTAEEALQCIETPTPFSTRGTSGHLGSSSEMDGWTFAPKPSPLFFIINSGQFKYRVFFSLVPP